MALLNTHLLPSSNGSSKREDADADKDADVDVDLGYDEDAEYAYDAGPRPVSLTATSYDTEAALLEKYPQSAGNVKVLREKAATVLHGVDVTKFAKLPKSLRRRQGAFDVVGFMFPHVGGLSTDVGRQVKSNQGQWTSRYLDSGGGGSTVG